MSKKVKKARENPASCLNEKILTGVISLNDQILQAESEELSIWGLTILQYNALRVIYEIDHNNAGLSNREIGEALTTRVPDVTRLLDRMAEKGWVIRDRDTSNRRIVRTRLTKIGKQLVKSANQPLSLLRVKLLQDLTEEEKEMLVMLLEKISLLA